MVICDNCVFKDAGCVVKSMVLANHSDSCSFHSDQQEMEKSAHKTLYVVSWPAGDKRIVQTHQGGQVLSSSKNEIK